MREAGGLAAKVFRTSTRDEAVKTYSALWLGAGVLIMCCLANLEHLIYFNEAGHCYRKLESKRANTKPVLAKRRSPGNYKFVFFDFDGRGGESEIGVDQETFERYGSTENIFELELTRGVFGSVALVSVFPNQDVDRGLLRRSCW